MVGYWLFVSVVVYWVYGFGVQVTGHLFVLQFRCWAILLCRLLLLTLCQTAKTNKSSAKQQSYQMISHTKKDNRARDSVEESSRPIP